VLPVTPDGLPVEAGPTVSDDLRRAVHLLQGFLVSGKVDLDRFQQALDGILGAETQSELAAVIRSLPAPVELTPPALRRQEPLEISTSMGEVRLDGRWQVSRITKINVGMGSVTIDLTGAEFDDWDVGIVVHTGMGEITVIVPCGFDVRLVGRNGAVKTVVEPPLPGFPVVRLSSTSDMGMIRVVHPTEKTQRRRRWRRRRQPAVGA
jgi:Cell wall-active antibiotics response 4TMS YvqF